MKTSMNQKCTDKSGTALLAVMGVVFLIAIVAASMVAMGRQQVFSAVQLRDYVKAQLIAEAGANDAYNLLKTNFAARLNPNNFPLKPFDNGTYHVGVTSISSNKASISSTGVYCSATAYVKLDIKNIPLLNTNGVPPLTSPWAFGVFCNGYLGFNGASEVKGAIHVNNYLTSNGAISWGTAESPAYIECSGAQGFSVNGASTITGTIKAPVIHVNGTVTEAVTGPVPTIQLPALDLATLYQTALANNQVVNGATVNKNENWGTIPGGVRWINGTLDVKGGGGITYVGCVIATGNIILNGSTTQTQVGNLPAFVSRDGAIELNGAQTINGLVYAAGDVRFNGSGSIKGAVMAGGNMIFNGSTDLDVTYANSNPNGPEATTADHVIITAWQD